MHKSQTQVLEFHNIFGHPQGGNTPALVSKELARKRVKYIQSELNELSRAIEEDDLVEIADALADIHYFVDGTNVIYGFDGEEIFDAVHHSNLTKLGEDGKPIYSDGSNPDEPAGKVLKGPNYVPPTQLIREILIARGADLDA